MFDKPRAADVQLQKLEALGQFAGGIAHDFNNILSIIDGYANRAMRDLATGQLHPDTLQKILLTVERGAGLTRQLLAFARQNMDMEEALPLEQALAEQSVLLKPLLGECVTLSLPQVTAPVFLHMSADQFAQIMVNLALNARDAMSGQGRLTVTAEVVPRDALPTRLAARLDACDMLLLQVSDDGPGIAPHLLPHIFDPFFTTKGQAMEGRSGSGLGLSVVYGLVDQLGGAIEARSDGGGATFALYLPLAPAPAAHATSAVMQAPSLKGCTVLLAEDEPELRDVLTLVLEDMDMKVLPAANGNDAMRVQAGFDGDIDFLLTDIMMPEMNGVQLSDLFTQERPQTNVVMMSGYPFGEGAGSAAVPAGADFLRKPFREDKIRQILERALARKAARLRDGDEPPPMPE